MLLRCLLPSEVLAACRGSHLCCDKTWDASAGSLSVCPAVLLISCELHAMSQSELVHPSTTSLHLQAAQAGRWLCDRVGSCRNWLGLGHSLVCIADWSAIQRWDSCFMRRVQHCEC
jgi:hypothetical protein